MGMMEMNMKGALAEKRALAWIQERLSAQYIAHPTMKWGRLDRMGVDIVVRNVHTHKVLLGIQVKSSTHGVDSYVGGAPCIVVAPEGSDEATCMPVPYVAVGTRYFNQVCK